MTPTTDDHNDPRLSHGSDTEPGPQAAAYLILSEKDRKKGLVRPVRRTYVHWTREDGSPAPLVVQNSDKLVGCGAATRMSQDIAETYAKDPKFYGSTYCVGCGMHLPVEQFTWDGTSELVGS